MLSGSPFWSQPIVPVIDAEMKAHLQAVLAFGLQVGNRPNVFVKVGDSITATPSFLFDLGKSGYNPANPAVAGAFTSLAPTIDYFRTLPIDSSGGNSFTHISWAATPGWGMADLLNPAHNLEPARALVSLPGETPLATEIRLERPGIALIMIGTNDLVRLGNPELFRAQLTYVVDMALGNGVIPILSTVPDDLFYGARWESEVPVYNQVIADVAATLEVPLWNYWLATQSLPNKGLSADEVHPSTYPPGSGYFTNDALQFGYNVRNLTAVEVLAKIKQVVLDNGSPDGVGARLPSPVAPAAGTSSLVPLVKTATLGSGTALGLEKPAAGSGTSPLPIGSASAQSIVQVDTVPVLAIQNLLASIDASQHAGDAMSVGFFSRVDDSTDAQEGLGSPESDSLTQAGKARPLTLRNVWAFPGADQQAADEAALSLSSWLDDAAGGLGGDGVPTQQREESSVDLD